MAYATREAALLADLRSQLKFLQRLLDDGDQTLYQGGALDRLWNEVEDVKAQIKELEKT